MSHRGEKEVPRDFKQKIEDWQGTAERRAGRKLFSYVFGFTIVFQLAFMDLILLGITLWQWEYDRTVVSIYVTGLFGSIASLVGIAMKYYFNGNNRRPRQN